jgi:dUTP pyrophosphatase
MTISRGDRFVQGIFLPYGVTINDKTTALRNGGFGSTNP